MGYAFDDLKGKVVIVTGSGRGIGRGIAETFADNGANVVITDIDEETCKKTAEEISTKGVETLAVVSDVTNREQIDNLVEKTLEKWGKIDVLVNNAGITMDTLFLRMKPEQWQKVVDINLTGVYNCTQAVIKPMSKAKSGVIVNISSIARHGNVGQANYSATKAGVVGFTGAIAREFAARGIRANAVAPGFIETPMTAAMPEKAQEAVVDAIPMKRPGQPEDIARAVLFLASDLAGYITGQTLDVNGGLSGL